MKNEFLITRSKVENISKMSKLNKKNERNKCFKKNWFWFIDKKKNDEPERNPHKISKTIQTTTTDHDETMEKQKMKKKKKNGKIRSKSIENWNVPENRDVINSILKKLTTQHEKKGEKKNNKMKNKIMKRKIRSHH